MVTIMVTKRPWTILIQHVVQSNISSVEVVARRVHVQYLAHTNTFHSAANEHLGGLCI